MRDDPKPKPVPLLDEAEVDALLQLVAGTVLSPEAAEVGEAARARLMHPPLRVIDGGEIERHVK